MEPQTTDKAKETAREVLKQFARLQKIDANALQNLKRLADMAEANRGKYFLALKFL